MDDTKQSALHGKRVLITRAREQSEGLFQELQALGAIPICAPCIQFEAPEDVGPLDRALGNLDHFDWVFFTSQNALRFVLERAARIGVRVPASGGKPQLAAVGPATAAAVEKAGLHVSYLSQKHQGIGLAEELGPRLNGLRVLLPRSDKAGEDLPRALREAGAQVEEVVAYRTLQTSSAADELARIVKSAQFDAVVFFSPSAVHHFCDTLNDGDMKSLRDRVIFVAIGPVTAGALKQSGIENVEQSSDTETRAVLDRLSAAFRSRAPQSSAGVRL